MCHSIYIFSDIVNINFTYTGDNYYHDCYIMDHWFRITLKISINLYLTSVVETAKPFLSKYKGYITDISFDTF